MYLRKKIRFRAFVVLLLAFGFIFWRGLKSTTQQTHNCEFKVVYAVCVPKNNRAVMPSVWDILKRGVEF